MERGLTSPEGVTRDQTVPRGVQLKLYLRVNPLLHMRHQFLHTWGSQLAYRLHLRGVPRIKFSDCRRSSRHLLHETG